MRVCIEYAGYAMLMTKKPNLCETWLQRDEQVSFAKLVRKEFNHSKIRNAISSKDVEISNISES